MKIKKSRNIDGTIEYRDEFGNLHREDGPAVIKPDGKEYWYKHGFSHRIGGPAVIERESGVELWYKDGKPHREDGPAFILPYETEGGTRFWYLQGKRIPYEFTSLQDLADNFPEYLI